MRKRLLTLLIVPFALTSCSLQDLLPINNSSSEKEFTPTSSQPNTSSEPSSEEEHPEVSFSIVSAGFTDEEGHLKVEYSCNYKTPFDVYGHEFKVLNVKGVMAKELDYSNQGYFTLLSPVVNKSLKFEFYDKNDERYITYRYDNICLYGEEQIHIDFPEGYHQLYWSDEFNDNTLDLSKWTHEIGNGSWGWGNNELEYYTDQNDTVSNGELTITAKKENIDSYRYTSTRIKTQNKFSFKYGYVEAKISLPEGTGMWPAFWMMPNVNTYGGWPHSGEIDIMEARGRFITQSSSALHFSTLNGDHTYITEVKNGHDITEYHKYAAEWLEDTIRFFVDDVCYLTIDKAQWTTSGRKNSETAPFDHEFYIIFNLAVGGNFDGGREPNSSFVSADMKIDYVRVFR